MVRMQSIAYALPIQPGKTEEYRRLMEEAHGRRNELHADSRRRMGVVREMAYVQKRPDLEWAIVYLEADDTLHASEVFAGAREPYDEWYKQQLYYVTGMDMNRPIAGAGMPEVLYEPDPRMERGPVAIASVLPIVPGKTDELRHYLSDVTDPRSDRMSKFLDRVGLKRMGIFLQTSVNGDALIFYMEGMDPPASRDRIAVSDHPDDVDWRAHLMEYTGIDYGKMPPVGEQIFSWEDTLRRKAA